MQLRKVEIYIHVFIYLTGVLRHPQQYFTFTRVASITVGVNRAVLGGIPRPSADSRQAFPHMAGEVGGTS